MVERFPRMPFLWSPQQLFGHTSNVPAFPLDRTGPRSSRFIISTVSTSLSVLLYSLDLPQSACPRPRFRVLVVVVSSHSGPHAHNLYSTLSGLPVMLEGRAPCGFITLCGGRSSVVSQIGFVRVGGRGNLSNWLTWRFPQKWRCRPNSRTSHRVLPSGFSSPSHLV